MRSKIKQTIIIGIMVGIIGGMGFNQYQLNDSINNQDEELEENNYYNEYYNITNNYYNITDILTNNTIIQMENGSELIQYYEYIEVNNVPQSTTTSVFNINVTNNTILNYVAIKSNTLGVIDVFCWYGINGTYIRDKKEIFVGQMNNPNNWYIFEEIEDPNVSQLPITIPNIFTSFNISIYYSVDNVNFDIIIGWIQ